MSKARDHSSAQTSTPGHDHDHTHAHDPSLGRGNAFMQEQLAEAGHDHGPHLAPGVAPATPLKDLSVEDREATLLAAQADLVARFGDRAKTDDREIRVVAQADMKAEYDTYYGGTEDSWDNRIVPELQGKLGGFAIQGDNLVVVSDTWANYGTVVHELIHTLVDGGFAGITTGGLEEGATDALAEEVAFVKGHGYDIVYMNGALFFHSTLGVSMDELADAYFGGSYGALDAAVKVAAEANGNSTYWATLTFEEVAGIWKTHPNVVSYYLDVESSVTMEEMTTSTEP